MDHIMEGRIAILERRQRLLLTMTTLGVFAFAVIAVLHPGLAVRAQEKLDAKRLTLSELVIVDNAGNVRLRLGGDLPDAVSNGKVKPRGQRAAGILL